MRDAGYRCLGGELEELPDGVEGRVVIGGGIDGQDLGDVERAVGIARDDIGEGAAAVDKELPFLMVRRSGVHRGFRCGVLDDGALNKRVRRRKSIPC